MAGQTTVLKAEPATAKVPAGSAVKVKYRFSADGNTGKSHKVFVHVEDQDGKRAWQADHDPDIGTGTPGWTGTVEYTKRMGVPANAKEGTYRILVGLYSGDERLALKAGEGVGDIGASRYHVADLVIDNSAPAPKADTENPPSLDLGKFELAWSEEFETMPKISSWNDYEVGDKMQDARWFAHTPWDGDFGDAAFAEPYEGRMDVKDGVFRITMTKDAEKFPGMDRWKRAWRAGCIANNTPHGKGFGLQYGYFVARIKMPAGPGVWPAFWLCSQYDRTKPELGKDGAVEIDVIEYYGVNPNGYQSAIHVWEPQPHWGCGNGVTTRKDEPVSGFHDYGCLVTKEFITMYFDNIEVWKVPTPPFHNKPLFVLLNLAAGSGWPIDKMISPSVMEIDYVRIYKPKE